MTNFSRITIGQSILTPSFTSTPMLYYCVLQLVVGFLATFISFIIIIQSANVIDLFANFAAMSVIAGKYSNLSSVVFSLSNI